MIAITAYAGKSVAVFGLGRSGLSAARALARGGARVLVWDDDPQRRQAADGANVIAVEPGRRAWAGIAALVLSPGVPLAYPSPHPMVALAESLGAEILGDVELFARMRPQAPVAAVTGTNGKSTTTALLAHLLRQGGRQVEAGANLGTPVLELEPLPAAGCYVLELSSYQIDLTMSLRPAVAVWLNLTPDHLDRHGDMDGYIAAKRRLLDMTPKQATLVIGIDDAPSAHVAAAMSAAGREVVPVTVGRAAGEGLFVTDGVLFAARAEGGEPQRLADLNGIAALRGMHNWQNAACAAAAARTLGMPDAKLQAALASFPGLAHRMEQVARCGNVSFVNDSKATNAESAAQALASYPRIHWIAGGLPKAGGIDALQPFFDRVVRAYLIGEAAPRFAATLDGKADYEISGTLERAVAAATAAARADGQDSVVLLSPACASFDQFANFEARGDAFRALAAAQAHEDRAGGSAGA